MSRKLRTTLPVSRELRRPAIPDHSLIVSRDERAKRRQKENFDARRGVKELPELSSGDAVWIPDRESSGEVVEQTSPRSYTVCTPGGLYRRNRAQVTAMGDILSEDSVPEESSASERTEEPTSPPNSTQGDFEQEETQSDQTVTPKVYPTRSRTGRMPPPIDRYDPSWT